MKANRSIYAAECTKLTGQIESLKKKLQKERIDETILDNGTTSNSKIVCELLDLELYDTVSKHPESKLSIQVGNEHVELEIHKSNVKKYIKM
jgi:hypothetical protein